jgi:rubrerythrin
MTKTDENLHAAFAGESMARNKYTYFAKVAANEGYHYISKIFLETADNEMQHAKEEFKLLKGISNTEANLQAAADGEHYETNSMYPDFEKQAIKDENKAAAILFKEVAEVEEKHEARYKKLLAMIKAGTVYARSKPIKWKCSKCGYIHEGLEPPEKCPCCHHEKIYFEPECMCFSGDCDCCRGIITDKTIQNKPDDKKKKAK